MSTRTIYHVEQKHEFEFLGQKYYHNMSSVTKIQVNVDLIHESL